jgi:calnexin
MVRFTTAAAALLAVSASVVRAEEATPEAAVEPYVPKVEFQYEFLETFQGDDVIKTKRWVQSSKDKYSGQSWVHATEFETVESGIVGDKSLITAIPHKHYGIVRALDTPVDPKGKDLVVQYEVRLNKGIGCSGAYLKLIAADDAFEPEQLSEDTGFSVMFGPDKCGGTNKVHLIIRVQNPITKEWEEKHMTKPVPTETDNLSHLYTLVIRNDDTFKVMVDSVVKAEGMSTI